MFFIASLLCFFFLYCYFFFYFFIFYFLFIFFLVHATPVTFPFKHRGGDISGKDKGTQFFLGFFFWVSLFFVISHSKFLEYKSLFFFPFPTCAALSAVRHFFWRAFFNPKMRSSPNKNPSFPMGKDDEYCPSSPPLTLSPDTILSRRYKSKWKRLMHTK